MIAWVTFISQSSQWEPLIVDIYCSTTGLISFYFAYKQQYTWHEYVGSEQQATIYELTLLGWTLKNSFYYSTFEIFYGWQKIRNEITFSVCIPKINEDIRHTTYELISETYYAAFGNPVFGFILSEYCSLLITINCRAVHSCEHDELKRVKNTVENLWIFSMGIILNRRFRRVFYEYQNLGEICNTRLDIGVQ